MKKNLLSLVFIAMCTITYAQKGDFFVGATGGYITVYKDGLYGLNTSYHLSDPLEISFTGVLNPNIQYKDNLTDEKSELKIFSASLELRYYMLLQRTWGMGPVVGGQYIYMNKKYENSANEEYTLNPIGFNLGWHARFNVTDNVKINGGWRYTSASKDASHHYMYIGVGYTFALQ